jgi:hypothetical protein
MTNEEIILEEVEMIKMDIVKRYHELGMKASGQFEQEAETVKEGKKYFIKGSDYSGVLVKGRKPGTMPPIQQIENWIKAKGIKPIEDNISISSLAFLIARAIKEKGTKYYQQGGTDLLDSVITPERMQQIINRVSEFNIIDLKNKIMRTLKEAA